VVIISELFHPIVWLFWQECSNKAEFSFYKEKLLFGAILNAYHTNVWFVGHTFFQSLQTNHTVGFNKSEIITTNQQYYLLGGLGDKLRPSSLEP